MARKPTAQMISELEGKLAELEAYQEEMKAANLVYRRKLAGKATEETRVPYVPYWKSEMGGKPYSDAELQSNRRVIQRTKERLAFLREREVKEKKASQEMPEFVHNHSLDREEAKENTKKRPSVRKYLEESRAASSTSYSYDMEKAVQEDMAAENMEPHKDRQSLRKKSNERDPELFSMSDKGGKQRVKPEKQPEKDSVRDYLVQRMAKRQDIMRASEEPVKSVQKHKKSFER